MGLVWCINGLGSSEKSLVPPGKYGWTFVRGGYELSDARGGDAACSQITLGNLFLVLLLIIINVWSKHLLKTFWGRFASLTDNVEILSKLQFTFTLQWFMYGDSDLLQTLCIIHYAPRPLNWVVYSRESEYSRRSCSERAGPSRFVPTKPLPVFHQGFFTTDV